MTATSEPANVHRVERLEIIDMAQPTETREFPRGRFDVFQVGGQAVGRATYQPGWRWSEHVGDSSGASLCQVEHLGLVISGRAAVRMADGTEQVMGPGDVFAIPPGHDSWVIGDEPYISVHLTGADTYADGER